MYSSYIEKPIFIEFLSHSVSPSGHVICLKLDNLWAKSAPANNVILLNLQYLPKMVFHM